MIKCSLTHCMPGNYACFLSSAVFFFEKCFKNTIRVSKSLDPYQARHFVILHAILSSADFF